MIEKEKLKDYANKLMFDMEDCEYETLQKEFGFILKQMELIDQIDEIKNVEPMTFPFEIDDVILREEDEIERIDYEIAFRNSDSIKDREIKVPKVVE